MYNDARTQLEIRPSTEADGVGRRYLTLYLIILAVLLVMAYFLGKYHADVLWEEAVEYAEIVENDLSVAIQENARLLDSLEFEKAKNKRDLQIKRQAYEEIADTLAATSREITSLKENIRFYESIIEGDDKKEGLQIKSVSLREEIKGEQFRYEVVLVNGDYSKRMSKGKLVVEMEGTRDGKLATIDAFNSNNGQAFSFKYFQRIGGTLTIPEGFVPKRLHITARFSGKKPVQKEKWYNWKILLNKNIVQQG
jgi:hypothetical protein